MKLYGSLNNRFDENRYFNGTHNNIKVGTPCTVYHYTDRDAYEVVEVIDQGHLFIRELKAIRTDDNGMSDAQTYRYESVPTNPTEEIKLTKHGWKRVERYTLEGFRKSCENMRDDCKSEAAATELAKYFWRMNLTENQFNKVLAGKDVIKTQNEINISFGIADKYYDYSF